MNGIKVQIPRRYAHAQKINWAGSYDLGRPWQFSNAIVLERHRFSKKAAYICALEPLKPLVSLVDGRLTCANG